MRKYLRAISILFLLTFSVVINAQQQNNVINVPRINTAVSVDVHNPNQWKNAKKVTTSDGSEILFQYDGKFLYVGFIGNFEAWGHLYLKSRNEVNVFHVTNAMGKVIYKLDSYDQWQPDRRFNWKMRDNDLKKYEKRNADLLLEKEGWIANYRKTPTSHGVIFKIDIKNYDKNNIYLAMVYGLRASTFLGFPADLKDDTINPDMFTGYNPADCKFNYKFWVLLKFAE